MTPTNTQPYLIHVGKADQPRAASLNLIFDPYSSAFFPFDAVRNNDQILFAGCGNGQLVVAIAKELQRRQLTVQIVAFDIAQKQLDCAKAYAQESGIDHIRWERHDAHDLKQYRGQFNVVHARFLLNHLSDAELVTQKLCETLVEEGLFIGEEFSGSDVEVSSDDPEHRQAVQQWERMVRLQHIIQKSDMTFANRLPDILRKNALLVTHELKPYPRAQSVNEKNIFPACMDSAPLIFPNDEHENIARIRTSLERVRDHESCSITFKHFTQIQALRRDGGHH